MHAGDCEETFMRCCVRFQVATCLPDLEAVSCRFNAVLIRLLLILSSNYNERCSVSLAVECRGNMLGDAGFPTICLQMHH